MYTHYICPGCGIGGELNTYCCGNVIHAGLQGMVVEEIIEVGFGGGGYVEEVVVVDDYGYGGDYVEEVIVNDGYGDDW